MDDLIIRQAAIDAVEEYFGDLPIVVHYDMLQLIKKLPSAERRGRWEQVGDNTYRCSACGEISCCKSLFCGDCGAKMVEK